MSREIYLGRLAGLRLSAEPSAIVGSILLWVVLSAFALLLLNFSLDAAILGGFAAMLLHWVSVFAHQLGHAWAARRTGYAMTGVRLRGLLSLSIYPNDEPALPASIHIRRALGGPQGSLLTTLIAALPPLLLSAGSSPWWVALFFFLNNLFVFTLGSFLPLGFTDGSTLLKWGRR
jgi:hypothetical protein